MKKFVKAYLLFGIFTALLSVVPANAQSSYCYDNETGSTTNFRGQLEYSANGTNNAIYIDKCEGSTLREYWCTYNGQPNMNGTAMAQEAVSCTFGCSNGTCYGWPVGCYDFDVSNDPNVKSKVQIAANNAARTVQSTQEDKCNPAGTKSIEYKCSSTGTIVVASELSCATGCLDGACVVPTAGKEGCYIRLEVSEVARSDGYSTFTVSKSTPAVGRYEYAVHSQTASAAPGYAIEYFDKSNVKIGRYPINSERIVFGEDLGTFAMNKGQHVIYLPLRLNASRVTFTNSSISGNLGQYTIPSSSLICVRNCVTPGESGWTGKQQRCPGTTLVSVTPSTFTCQITSTPSPSPTPSL